MSRRRVGLLLGTTQTLSWAGSCHLPAILAGNIARDLGVKTSTIFVAFSLAMLLTGVLGRVSGASLTSAAGAWCW